MGDEYFVTRDSRTGYFTDSRTSSPKAEPKTTPVQTTSVNSSAPYSTSSARVVIKKYALKRD